MNFGFYFGSVPTFLVDGFQTREAAASAAHKEADDYHSERCYTCSLVPPENWLDREELGGDIAGALYSFIEQEIDCAIAPLEELSEKDMRDLGTMVIEFFSARALFTKGALLPVDIVEECK